MKLRSVTALLACTLTTVLVFASTTASADTVDDQFSNLDVQQDVDKRRSSFRGDLGKRQRLRVPADATGSESDVTGIAAGLLRTGSGDRRLVSPSRSDLGRRSSTNVRWFRPDLGKRDDGAGDRMWWTPKEDDEKRGSRSGFRRLDLGKRRPSGFRGDLGKRSRRSVEDMSTAAAEDLDGGSSELLAAGEQSILDVKRAARKSAYRGDLGKRRSSFRGDLGKRDSMDDVDQLFPNEDDTDDENIDEELSSSAADKRRSRLRGDLGKRGRSSSKYRGDLGKRPSSSRGFRGDLGKRAWAPPTDWIDDVDSWNPNAEDAVDGYSATGNGQPRTVDRRRKREVSSGNEVIDDVMSKSSAAI